MAQLAPIVLFAYNRPQHTQATLQSLSKNKHSQNSELFIYVDRAPANASVDDVNKNNEVIKFVQNSIWLAKTNVVVRTKNYGLAKNIVDGVTTIVNRYEKIIVLEDDLITSVGFLDFMNKGLDIYENVDKIMAISGYTVPNLSFKTKETLFFRSPGSWGWATWKRAWNQYSDDIDKHMDNIQSGDINHFNIDGNYNYFEHLKLNKLGRLNTWAIKWYSTIYFNKGLVLYPSKSLVRNIGFDGLGVNCGNSRMKIFNDQRLIKSISPKKKQKLKEDKKIVAQFATFWWYSVYDFDRSILRPSGFGKRITKFAINLVEKITLN